jgi:hypothetical protein
VIEGMAGWVEFDLRGQRPVLRYLEYLVTLDR